MGCISVLSLSTLWCPYHISQSFCAACFPSRYSEGASSLRCYLLAGDWMFSDRVWRQSRKQILVKGMSHDTDEAVPVESDWFIGFTGKGSLLAWKIIPNHMQKLAWIHSQILMSSQWLLENKCHCIIYCNYCLIPSATSTFTCNFCARAKRKCHVRSIFVKHFSVVLL